MNREGENVLAALDGFRMCDQMDYAAYSQLHDMISVLDVPKWISVKDRLPEEKQFVLVYGESLHSNKHDAGCMAVSWRVDYNYWFGFGRTGAITHWMPLPEPPKEETK